MNDAGRAPLPPPRSLPLGTPLPDAPHAVSVSLPRWADVVAYEERDAATMAALRSGYPRFVVHPLVRQLARRLTGDAQALPFPSRRVAEQAAAYVRGAAAQPASVTQHGELAAVATPPAGQTALKAFWQHAGLIVCSRQAEAALAGAAPPADADEVRRVLAHALAALYDCGADDVLLAPTGMAAQHAALQAVAARRPGQATAQLGFPYVDTLKLQERLGAGAVLLHDVSRMAEDLERLLQQRQLAACFSEIPGNPMLGCVDLPRLSPLLRRAGVPVVADDVVATPINVDLAQHADLIATSLTKYVVGTGDAMGGALICNPRSPLYAELKALARDRHEELLWAEDARRIAQHVQSLPERMARHNAHGLVVAERLRRHPAVERVWYPRWDPGQGYEAVRRRDAGWGSLISFLPRNPAASAPGFYDRLDLAKGPSLGTVFTLVCPFTLLAHYGELAWAEACGVPRNLIRISVGLEDVEQVWAALARALEEC